MENTTTVTTVGEADRAHLARAGKWARFIAIVGFVGTGLGLVSFIAAMLVIFVAGAVPAMPLGAGQSGFMLAYFVVMLAVLAFYFIPLSYLYKFGGQASAAAAGENDGTFSDALANLARFFRFVGVVTLVTIALMVVLTIAAWIVVGVAAASGGM